MGRNSNAFEALVPDAAATVVGPGWRVGFGLGQGLAELPGYWTPWTVSLLTMKDAETGQRGDLIPGDGRHQASTPSDG